LTDATGINLGNNNCPFEATLTTLDGQSTDDMKVALIPAVYTQGDNYLLKLPFKTPMALEISSDDYSLSVLGTYSFLITLTSKTYPSETLSST
jgi:hypothetical protein